MCRKNRFVFNGGNRMGGNKKGKRKKYKFTIEEEDIEVLPLYMGLVKKKRECLMCSKMFDSRSAGNRRCPACTRLSKIYLNGRNEKRRVHLPGREMAD